MTTAAVLAEFEPLRIGLAQTFSAAGIEVISQAGALEELIGCGTEELVDVNVIELRALGPDLELLRGREAWLRRQRAVFLGTMSGSSGLSISAVERLTRAESVALVESDGEVSRLIDIVELVARGMFVCDMSAMKPVFSRLSLFADRERDEDAVSADRLSPRELEVVKLVAEGMDNRHIAHEMVVSEGTVKAHVSHILAKLSVRNRTELARYALTRAEFPLPLRDVPTGEAEGMHRHVTVRVTARATPLQRDKEAGDSDPK